MPGFRIAMLSVHTCPLATLGGKETGGMNVYVRDLSRELARRGHHVDVYTRSQDPDIPRVVDRSRNQVFSEKPGFSHADGLTRGTRVIHIPAGPEQPYDKHLVYDHLPEFVDGVLAQTEADGIRYDVLHSHYWLSGVAARELCRRWGTPIVHMFHTLGKMKNAVARRPEERETARRIEIEAEIVRFADARPSRRSSWCGSTPPTRPAYTSSRRGWMWSAFIPFRQRTPRSGLGYVLRAVSFSSSAALSR
jgi:D-inositol-3-phosphate glycosyltransferase